MRLWIICLHPEFIISIWISHRQSRGEWHIHAYHRKLIFLSLYHLSSTSGRACLCLQRSGIPKDGASGCSSRYMQAYVIYICMYAYRYKYASIPNYLFLNVILIQIRSCRRGTFSDFTLLIFYLPYVLFLPLTSPWPTGSSFQLRV